VDPRATFLPLCLSDHEAVTRAVQASGAEAVLHFAAHALVGESMTNPAKYFRKSSSTSSAATAPLPCEDPVTPSATANSPCFSSTRTLSS